MPKAIILWLVLKDMSVNEVRSLSTRITPSLLSVLAATSPAAAVPGSSSGEAVLPAPPIMFRAGNYIDNTCLRCRKTVYPTDKIGPLKDYTFFHSGCFRCFVCNCKLTLKTYFNNQVGPHVNDKSERTLESFLQIALDSFVIISSRVNRKAIQKFHRGRPAKQEMT